MNCPFCDADTQVVRTRLTDDGHQVARERVCKGLGKHKIETAEREMLRLDQIGVRQSGSQRVAGPFNRERLLEDVLRALFYRRTNREQRAHAEDIVSGVERELLRRHNLFEPNHPDRRTEPNQYREIIIDTTITRLVEQQLEGPELRIQKVLYALFARGRGDRTGRDGWQSAHQALTWILKEFPDLPQRHPRIAVDRREFRWYPPKTIPQPRTVIKKSSKPVPFVYEQFLKSIKLGLLGRHSADETAVKIASWVLDNLGGQTTVHSGQLSIGVLECLRRVDDIAFLRYAIVVKRYDSVTAIAEEALGLIMNPSPRLLLEMPDVREVVSGEPLVS